MAVESDGVLDVKTDEVDSAEAVEVEAEVETGSTPSSIFVIVWLVCGKDVNDCCVEADVIVVGDD